MLEIAVAHREFADRRLRALRRDFDDVFPHAIHVERRTRAFDERVAFASIEKSAAMREPRDVSHIDERRSQRVMRLRMRQDGDFVFAVDDVARVPPCDRTEGREAVRRAFRRSQRAHARRAEHPRVLQRCVTFFRRRREIVMKNAVDQKDGVVLASGALDIAAAGGRQIDDRLAGDTIFRRQRRTGKNRHRKTVSAHSATRWPLAARSP